MMRVDEVGVEQGGSYASSSGQSPVLASCAVREADFAAACTHAQAAVRACLAACCQHTAKQQQAHPPLGPARGVEG